MYTLYQYHLLTMLSNAMEMWRQMKSTVLYSVHRKICPTLFSELDAKEVSLPTKILIIIIRNVASKHLKGRQQNWQGKRNPYLDKLKQMHHGGCLASLQ